MRYIQSLLFVIGMTALGTVLGFFALAIVLSLFQRPGAEPWTEGFGQYIGGLVCGAPLGALSGLAASVGYVIAQEDSTPWSPLVWIGILAGLLAGAGLAVHLGMASGNQSWIPVTLVATGGGSAGGILGRVGLALYSVVRRASGGDGS